MRRAEIARIIEVVPAEPRPTMVTGLLTFAEAAGEQADEAWTAGWE